MDGDADVSVNRMQKLPVRTLLFLFGLAVGIVLSEFATRLFEDQLVSTSSDDRPHSIIASNELSIVIAGESTAGGEPFYNTPPRALISYYLSRFAPTLSPRFEEVIRFGGSLRRTYQDIVKAIDRFEPQVVITMFGNNDYLGEYSAGKSCEEGNKGLIGTMSEYSALARLLSDRIFPENLESAPAESARSFFDNAVVCQSEMRRIESTHAKLLQKLYRISSQEGGHLIPVFLASNEVDFEPNRSILKAGASQHAALSDAYSEGQKYIKQGLLDEALVSFENSYRFDITFAYINFALGRTYLSLQNFNLARRHLSLAVEYDGFPYRLKPALRNRLISEARKHGDSYIDLDEALRNYAPHQILDGRFFNDVHHPTLEGYNILAFEVVKRIRDIFPNIFVSTPHLISLPEVIEALNIDQSVWYEVALHNLTWTSAYQAMTFEPSHRNEVMRRNLHVLDSIDKPYTDHLVSPNKRKEIEELSAKYPKSWKQPPLEDLWSGFNATISSKYNFKGFKPLAFHSLIPVSQNKNVDGSPIRQNGADVEGFILHPWADRAGAVLVDLTNAAGISGDVSIAVTGTAASTAKCSLEVDGKKVFETEVLNIKSPPAHFNHSLNNNERALLLCNDASDGNAFDHVLISSLSVK